MIKSETMTTPPQTQIWDYITLFLGGLALAAFLVIPWMGSVEEGSFTGLQLLLGAETEANFDLALLFLVPIFGVFATLSTLWALVSPPDNKRLAGFAFSAGLLGLFYYFNYFVVKSNSFAETTQIAEIGFWLGLAASIGLVAQRYLPRPDIQTKTETRLDIIMQDERAWGLLLLAPMAILMLVFTIYPVFRSIQMTMYNWRGIGEATQYVGLRHFQTVATDPWFWNAFWNTVQYAAVLVPVQLTLALMLALVLDNPRMRLRTFYKTVYFLPVVTSVAIVAIVVRLMLNSGSLMLSDMLNIRPAIYPLGDADYSMWAVIVFGTWYSFGINLVYFLAALQTVPEELYDAAKVDGANWMQRLLYVTLPGIRPVAIIILFFAILGSLRVFEQSFVLTQGGPFFSSEVVSGYIYNYAFSGGGQGRGAGAANIGYASAAAFFMSLLILGVTFVQVLVTRFALNNRNDNKQEAQA